MTGGRLLGWADIVLLPLLLLQLPSLTSPSLLGLFCWYGLEGVRGADRKNGEESDEERKKKKVGAA